MKKVRLVSLRAAIMRDVTAGRLANHHRMLMQRREEAMHEDMTDTQVLPVASQAQHTLDVIDDLIDITINLIFIAGLLVLTCAAVIILACLGQALW